MSKEKTAFIDGYIQGCHDDWRESSWGPSASPSKRAEEAWDVREKQNCCKHVSKRFSPSWEKDSEDFYFCNDCGKTL